MRAQPQTGTQVSFLNVTERLLAVEDLLSSGRLGRCVAASASGQGLVCEQSVLAREGGLLRDSVWQVGLDPGVDLVGCPPPKSCPWDEAVVVVDKHPSEAHAKSSWLTVAFSEPPSVMTVTGALPSERCLMASRSMVSVAAARQAVPTVQVRILRL